MAISKDTKAFAPNFKSCSIVSGAHWGGGGGGGWQGGGGGGEVGGGKVLLLKIAKCRSKIH